MCTWSLPPLTPQNFVWLFSRGKLHIYSRGKWRGKKILPCQPTALLCCRNGRNWRWTQECMARNEKNPPANTLNMVTSPRLLLQWNLKHKEGFYKVTWRVGQKLTHATSCRSTSPSLSTVTMFEFNYVAYPTSLTLYDTGGMPAHVFSIAYDIYKPVA